MLARVNAPRPDPRDARERRDGLLHLSEDVAEWQVIAGEVDACSFAGGCAGGPGAILEFLAPGDEPRAASRE